MVWPHRKCGKLVVATKESEIARLEAVHKQAVINGCEGVELIDQAEARDNRTGRLLPHCHAFARDRHHRQPFLYAGDAGRPRRPGRDGGASTQESSASCIPKGASRCISAAMSRSPVDAVINAAGLGAQKLASVTEGYPTARVPRLVLAKGNYFSYAGRPVFTRLVYPVSGTRRARRPCRARPCGAHAVWSGRGMDRPGKL